MRTRKMLLYDGVLALAVIFLMNSCEKAFSTEKVIKIEIRRERR